MRFEVSKDDRTLWVNGAYCLGRICSFGFEIMEHGIETFRHYPKGFIKPPDWEFFKEIHNIEFDETPPEKLFDRD